jgi:hypothetical protein
MRAMIKKRAERNLLAVIVELSFGLEHNMHEMKQKSVPFTVFLSESENNELSAAA